MLTITKLKMWKDPGYTRQCVEVPPVGSKKLPTPDYVSSETLRPRRGALLNAVELPLSYIAVHDMSYLYMEISDGQETPNTMSVFGWILSVEEIASSNEAVIIHWTPDYWRTYSDSATFGKGTITRCANATYKRPFLTQPRRWKVNTSGNIKPATGVPLGFVIMTSETDPNDPDVITGFSYYWEGLDDTSVGERTLTKAEMYSGKIDEILGLTPSSIIGAWIVPAIVTKSTFFTGTTTVTRTYGADTITVKKSTGLTGNYSTVTIADLANIESDDMSRIVAVDPYGNICSELPWGFKMGSTGSLRYSPDISAEGITIYLRPDYLVNDIGGVFPDRFALTVGCFFTISGLSVPLNTNAWSEYAFTYQRSYDKRMAEIQRNQRAVSGVTSTGSSMVGGAIAGATRGGGAGAIGGALAGGTLSLIGSAIDFFSAPYFNDEIQRETDKLTSNQTSNVMIGGGGFGWKEMSETWMLVALKADATSLAEYTAKISNDGYDVEIPVGTPSAFLTAGGPLQIQNLVLTGGIPPEAKTYIKNILSNGVRIVENNPSGVVP